MRTVSITIDGKILSAPEGEKILWVALANGIYIPNLCAIHEAADPYAGCRLCFVEVKGLDAPVTACTEPVSEGMVINTKGPQARRLARTSLELLLSNHPVDCAHCAKNKTCELQKIAVHLKIKIKTDRFKKLERISPIDSSNPIFYYDPNKCVLCGRCVWVCRDKLNIGVLGFAQRGINRVVTTFENKPIAETNCKGCGDCASVCPVGSLVFK